VCDVNRVQGRCGAGSRARAEEMLHCLGRQKGRALRLDSDYLFFFLVDIFQSLVYFHPKFKKISRFSVTSNI